MIFLIGSLVIIVACTVSVVRTLRRIYHDKLTDAYCEGFRDGVAYEAKVQAEHGKRAVVRVGMSVN